MSVIKLIVIDNDLYYLNNLTNYITTEYKEMISVVSFSNKEFLLEYVDGGEITDIVLASQEFYDEISEKYTLGKLILLSNNNIENGNVENIYKYQSADKSCKEIIDIYNRKNSVKNKANNESEVITFYSPIGGAGTTTLAIATALKFAQNGNHVLYLNFEKIQSNGIFMPQNYSKYNFSDLIMSIKEGDNEFNEILLEGTIKYDEFNLYYFNPIDSVLDVEDVSLEDIKDLVNNIVNSNKFNYIIIDLPSVLDSKYYYMFDRSADTIVIMGQDTISTYKIDTMLKQLDNISKFKFIINMCNGLKEKKIPKLVSENLLPIISTIQSDDKIKGETDIVKLLSENSIFNNEIIKIVNKIG
ncbi:AAA family ATPase [Clostridium gasigenes]|uniref:AAA family ATPase n=1 Tax=Clostridium gasigenes TaxID=94869 RepID=A0A7X0VSM6_9CLOT|nr:AAA family ATPase [Clostridium gasigenes]MBB6716654.1 AAA family ATPase [Clostridium gasigenes]